MLQSPTNYDSSSCQCSLYDFPHSLLPLSKEALRTPSQLLHIYNQLLEDVTKKWLKNHSVLDSYNLLLMKEWMMIIPRSQVVKFIVYNYRNRGIIYILIVWVSLDRFWPRMMVPYFFLILL